MDSKGQYNLHWEALKRDPRGFELSQEPLFESGDHPQNFVDHECAFASFHIQRVKPGKILDIGSYRHFILGLLAHYSVTAVEIRGMALFPCAQEGSPPAFRLQPPENPAPVFPRSLSPT